MKVVPAFLRAEHIADFADGFEELGKAAGANASQVSLELGERLFDRVQVGRVGRQEEKPAPGLAHGFPGLGVVMGGEVVEVRRIRK